MNLDLSEEPRAATLDTMAISALVLSLGRDLTLQWIAAHPELKLDPTYGPDNL